MPRPVVSRVFLWTACVLALPAPALPMTTYYGIGYPLAVVWQHQLMALLRPGPINVGKLGGLGSLVLLVSLMLFILSSPWLVRFYARSNPLRWIARLLAVAYAGLLATCLHLFLSHPQPVPGSALLLLTSAALLHFIGLCLIDGSGNGEASA